MTIEEYAERLRAEPANRYAVAFGQVEAIVQGTLDPAAQVAAIRRISKAMDLVERAL